MSSAVSSTALKIPSFTLLDKKRIVLASASPRRKEIFEAVGLTPEIVPSTFTEDLSQSQFEDIHEYPVATASEKAIEVYERLVREDPDNPPDLVIGADTVVLTHAQPGAGGGVAYSLLPDVNQELLEKPQSKDDQFRMLLDLNGNVCEVVTGVVVVYPILTAPGYASQQIDERSLVHFADSNESVLRAYVENGEGIDRAGGFAIQGHGSILIRKIDGDYNNVVGFPMASFVKLLETCVEEVTDFLQI